MDYRESQDSEDCLQPQSPPPSEHFSNAVATNQQQGEREVYLSSSEISSDDEKDQKKTAAQWVVAFRVSEMVANEKRKAEERKQEQAKLQNRLKELLRQEAEAEARLKRRRELEMETGISRDLLGDESDFPLIPLDTEELAQGQISSYEYLLVFPKEDTGDADQSWLYRTKHKLSVFQQKRNERLRERQTLLRHLREAGLSLTQFRSRDHKTYFVRITADHQRFLSEAERMRLVKKTLSGSWRTFTQADSALFFTQAPRQSAAPPTAAAELSEGEGEESSLSSLENSPTEMLSENTPPPQSPTLSSAGGRGGDGSHSRTKPNRKTVHFATEVDDSVETASPPPPTSTTPTTTTSPPSSSFPTSTTATTHPPSPPQSNSPTLTSSQSPTLPIDASDPPLSQSADSPDPPLPQQGQSLRSALVRPSAQRRRRHEGSEESTDFFTMAERQSIIRHIIFAKVEEGGAGVDPYGLSQEGIIDCIFPIHQKQALASLFSTWMLQTLSPGERIYRLFSAHQPLDEINEYFGHEIAYYFAFLAFLTRNLILPAVVGVPMFLYIVVYRDLSSPAIPFFAFFMSLWATVFLEQWKRHAAALAYKWGTMDMLATHDDDEIRPEFRGRFRVSPVTNEIERFYPTRKRRRKKVFLTWPAIFLLLSGLVVMMYWFFSIGEESRADDDSSIVEKYLPGAVIYGAIIPIINWLYQYLAVFLNRFENYRTMLAFRNNLIVKSFLFQFVNTFASIFLIAFVNVSFSTGKGQEAAVMERISTTVGAFLLVGLVWQNITEVFLPLIMNRISAWYTQVETSVLSFGFLVHHKINFARKKKKKVDKPTARGDSSTSVQLTEIAPSSSSSTSSAVAVLGQSEDITQQIKREVEKELEEEKEMESAEATAVSPMARSSEWKETRLQPYDTFDDYAELMVQFGFVTVFAIAFPLAPLLAFLNNILEIRIDAFKMVQLSQRPPARRAAGIGYWYRCLKVLEIISVITNAMLIGYTSTAMDSFLSNWAGERNLPVAKLAFVLLIEHFFLITHIAIAEFVADVPKWVKIQLQRTDFLLKQQLGWIVPKENKNNVSVSMSEDDHGYVGYTRL